MRNYLRIRFSVGRNRRATARKVQAQRPARAAARTVPAAPAQSVRSPFVAIRGATSPPTPIASFPSAHPRRPFGRPDHDRRQRRPRRPGQPYSLPRGSDGVLPAPYRHFSRLQGRRASQSIRGAFGLPSLLIAVPSSKGWAAGAPTIPDSANTIVIAGNYSLDFRMNQIESNRGVFPSQTCEWCTAMDLNLTSTPKLRRWRRGTYSSTGFF